LKLEPQNKTAQKELERIEKVGDLEWELVNSLLQQLHICKILETYIYTYTQSVKSNSEVPYL
jgi:hypothetical protein